MPANCRGREREKVAEARRRSFHLNVARYLQVRRGEQLAAGSYPSLSSLSLPLCRASNAWALSLECFSLSLNAYISCCGRRNNSLTMWWHLNAANRCAGWKSPFLRAKISWVKLSMLCVVPDYVKPLKIIKSSLLWHALQLKTRCTTRTNALERHFRLMFDCQSFDTEESFHVPLFSTTSHKKTTQAH